MGGNMFKGAYSWQVCTDRVIWTLSDKYGNTEIQDEGVMLANMGGSDCMRERLGSCGK